jgi:hypothetical protein
MSCSSADSKVSWRPEATCSRRPTTTPCWGAASRCRGVAALAAILTLDIPGVFFGKGPLGATGVHAPQAGIGFIEAHGLALILAILMWRATSAGSWRVTAGSRAWHVTAAAIHVLLGSANLVAWEFFVSTDSLAAGYITTSLHWLLVALQLLAACGLLGRMTATGREPAAAAV